MVNTMQFVGGTVEDLLQHGGNLSIDDDVVGAAEALLTALQPIGESFDVPWKFSESLDVLETYLPEALRQRLADPGNTCAENHLEACVVALALEAGVRLQPLTKADMVRLQHVAQHATDQEAWGRQSSYPWDTVATADLEGLSFFALSVGT